MWQRLREELGKRRWLAVAVALYLALTSVELARVLLFDRPASGAAGVYQWEVAPATTGSTGLSARLRIEDGGARGAPAPPSDVVAFAVSSSRVDVSWVDNADDEQGFKLQRATPQGVWSTSWIGHDRTIYTDEGLRGGTYCYRVRSFNTAGHSLYAYPSPPCVDAIAPVPFRWTSRRARLREPLAGPVVSLRLYAGRPDIGEHVIPVDVSVNGRSIERLTLRQAGWHRFTYYLPILVEAEVWQAARRRLGDGGGTEGQASAAGGGAGTGRAGGTSPEDEEQGLQELSRWRADPRPPSVSFDFEVGTSIVPARYIEGVGDTRELGVGVADPEWSDRLPADGIGFYDWEESDDGRRFRWTRMQASQPAARTGSVAVFSLRADHPDIDRLPVTVRVFWNERDVGEIVLRDRSWNEARIDLGDSPENAGVLSLRTDRTWVPAETGSSTDTRRLGVAITQIELQ